MSWRRFRCRIAEWFDRPLGSCPLLDRATASRSESPGISARSALEAHPEAADFCRLGKQKPKSRCPSFSHKPHLFLGRLDTRHRGPVSRPLKRPGSWHRRPAIRLPMAEKAAEFLSACSSQAPERRRNTNLAIYPLQVIPNTEDECRPPGRSSPSPDVRPPVASAPAPTSPSGRVPIDVNSSSSA